MGTFFHCKLSPIPTEEYKPIKNNCLSPSKCNPSIQVMQANRTLVHAGKGVRYGVGGCTSLGGITCVVTFISPLLVQPQEKPEMIKSHGGQISQGFLGE
jgi:hypothetical protein